MDLLKKSELYENAVIKLAKDNLLQQISIAQKEAYRAAKKARALYNKLKEL
jgi:hypothetical protein